MSWGHCRLRTLEVPGIIAAHSSGIRILTASLPILCRHLACPCCCYPRRAAPFTGQALSWGFDYVGGSQEDDSYDISHMCQTCDWEGECKWVPAADYDVYHVSEFGQVGGPKAGTFEKRAQAMMAEIYARGPIACGIASDPDSFDLYTGGVITDPSKLSDEDVDHVIVLAGWGVSEDGVDFWVGRNSYGGRWGEGAGGGWFRVARGNNTLAIESDACSWAVPHPASVKRAMAQQYASVAV